MQILDEIWKHPKRAKEILAKYSEQNRSILEQERMLDARMKKSRLSKTILDVDESEDGMEEQSTSGKAARSPKTLMTRLSMPKTKKIIGLQDLLHTRITGGILSKQPLDRVCEFA